MTPTFLDDGKRVAIIGTPGGSRIITMVLLAALEFSRGGDAETLVSKRRYHHQFFPDVLSHEAGAFDADEIAALEQRGHKLRQMNRLYGNMQAVVWDRHRNRVEASADPRGGGQGQVGSR